MRYGHYHVDLEMISVNGITIPNHLTPIKGNTIIDTWTTILNSAGESYGELKSHIDNFIDEKLNNFSDGQLECYNGTVQRELASLPTVTLTFYKGVSLDLDLTSLFQQIEEEYFCLAVMMTPEINLNIIWTTVFQMYNIGFDLEDETIYFEKISCDLLY
ncbi:putative aspartic peptidase A1 family, aspartic peptidase domain superfamily, xylanase inhibitor [Arabidopsis thaliana]